MARHICQEIRALLLIVACLPLAAVAQEDDEYRLEIGAGAGVVSYVGDFKHHRTSFHLSHKELWFAFTRTHFYIKWFLGYWCMWENPNPDFTTTLNITGNRLTSSLNLLGIDTLIVK